MIKITPEKIIDKVSKPRSVQILRPGERNRLNALTCEPCSRVDQSRPAAGQSLPARQDRVDPAVGPPRPTPLWPGNYSMWEGVASATSTISALPVSHSKRRGRPPDVDGRQDMHTYKFMFMLALHCCFRPSHMQRRLY